MSSWTMYFLLKLDAVVSLCFGLWFVPLVGLVVLVVLWAAMAAPPASNTTVIKRIVKVYSWFTVFIVPVFLLASVFLPSTKEMAAIIVVPKVCNAIESNKDLMQLPGDIVSLASAWLKELRPENIKEGAKTSDNRPSTKAATE